MAVITKHVHFNPPDEWMFDPSSQPQITLQPVLACHGRCELRLGLEYDARLEWIHVDGAKVLQGRQHLIKEFSDDMVFADEMIVERILAAHMPWVGSAELAPTLRAHPKWFGES